jgi:hypothetical protein
MKDVRRRPSRFPTHETKFHVLDTKTDKPEVNATLRTVRRRGKGKEGEEKEGRRRKEE